MRHMPLTEPDLPSFSGTTIGSVHWTDSCLLTLFSEHPTLQPNHNLLSPQLS